MNRADFHKLVWGYYRDHGRDNLPWRQDITPYRVLVSEIMLQQTQVPRVIDKFNTWMELWPDCAGLAGVNRAAVLEQWQGLGYNNRALRLGELAALVVKDYAGKLPTERTELEQLPGIGPYTSGAIMAFAYDQPVSFVDTNIRRVFLHHFFPDREDVTDGEVLEKVTAMLPSKQYRQWYWALMNYGSHLGDVLRAANPNRRSRHYVKQSAFVGSDRQMRGALVRALLTGPASLEEVARLVTVDIDQSIAPERLQKILGTMVAEGLVTKNKKLYKI